MQSLIELLQAATSTSPYDEMTMPEKAMVWSPWISAMSPRHKLMRTEATVRAMHEVDLSSYTDAINSWYRESRVHPVDWETVITAAMLAGRGRFIYVHRQRVPQSVNWTAKMTRLGPDEILRAQNGIIALVLIERCCPMEVLNILFDAGLNAGSPLSARIHKIINLNYWL